MSQVSVIVATYRREKELKNALESLAKQSYSDLEIILVDDNSDNEWNLKVSNIVYEINNQFPNVNIKCIVNNPNQGSAKARNIGIKASRGEFITFLDDDDVYLPDKVKKQIEYMKNGQYDYSITDLVLCDENDKEIDKRIRSYITNTDVASLRINHLKYHMTGTDTMMFKKDYLLKIGGFDPIDVGDEFYLMQKAIENEGKFGYLNCCDVKAYVHTGECGLSSGESKIKGENALYEYKKTFFDKLDKKTIRYIHMRHYAVIAFAELRRSKYGAFMLNSAKSFFCSPIECMKLLISRKI